MTIFNNEHAFVWIWLPKTDQPIIAGKLERNGDHHDFFYGKSYLNNPDAIALSTTELPLLGQHRFTSTHDIHLTIQDSLPDAWGQRILSHQYKIASLSKLDMLLLSSSDRIGALHFQSSASAYQAYAENHATIDELQQVSELIEAGAKIPKGLDIALLHGTSVGGARPKALINEKNAKYIAKFSSSTDLFPIVQAEYAAMALAKKAGLNVSSVKLVKVAGKYALLVERFDRIKSSNGWSRLFINSALTLLGLGENEARYASYLDLADQIRRSSIQPKVDLQELYRRMIFNILIGNTDDHAKNHAFYWDGKHYKLTPAYDICPYPRSGRQATQAMVIGKLGTFSLLSNALTAAPWFSLTDSQAKTEIDQLVDAVKTYWPEACREAQLSEIQQKQLTGSAVLNPFCFYDTP